MYSAIVFLPLLGFLIAGLFGRVAIPVAEVSALRVPAAAVHRRGQLEILFVVEDGRARLRLIRTGKRVGDAIEVLSGIDAGAASASSVMCIFSPVIGGSPCPS